jgi:hypothetical protein
MIEQKRGATMAKAAVSSIAKKLNLKDDMRLRVVGKPDDVNLNGITITTSIKAFAVLVFAKTLAELDKSGGPVIEAARIDRIAWIAYPKGNQLETNLNRDILWKHMRKYGIDGIRLIALDDVWSAMRFRPGK